MCMVLCVILISVLLSSSVFFQTALPVFAFCVMQTLGKLHFGSRYQVLLTLVLKLTSAV